MTKEEKQILIKDLCERLPYSIRGLHRGEALLLHVMDNSGSYMVLGYNAWFNLDTVPFKPYLRSMSSMTKEEIEECKQLQEDTIHVRFYKYDDGYEKIIDLPYFEILIDFFNSHHLDFRGLIPMGLALEAPEDMYKNKLN